MNINSLWKEPGVISLATGGPVLRMKDGCDVWTDPTFKQHKLKNHSYDEILKEGVEILESLRIFCWLSAGTLLGIHRDNALIENDTDIDIGIYGRDYKEKIERAFYKKGYKLIRAADKDNKPQQRAWQKNDVVFDIACYYDDNNNHYVNYVDYGYLSKPAILLEGAVDIKYKDKIYRCPSPDEYCIWRYGKTWKIPKRTKGIWAKAMRVGK